MKAGMNLLVEKSYRQLVYTYHCISLNCLTTISRFAKCNEIFRKSQHQKRTSIYKTCSDHLCMIVDVIGKER